MKNPNNFIVNSDYPFDMVAKVMTGSVVKQKALGQAVSIEDYIKVPHNLNFTPLVAGYWSDTEDFTNSYNFGYYSSGSDRSIGFDGCGADSENLYLLPMGTVGNQYWYRVFCLVPMGIATKVNRPSLSGFQDHIFNSDLAYMKILKDGEVQWTGEDIIVPHNLGFVPFVRMWGSFYSGLDQRPELLTTDSANATITTENLIIHSPKVVKGRTYYRIYADET